MLGIIDFARFLSSSAKGCFIQLDEFKKLAKSSLNAEI